MLDIATNPPLPPQIAALSIAERMAMVIREKRMQGQPTTRDDFRQALETSDLTDAQLDAHLGAAKRLVHPEVVRQEQPATPVMPWDHDPEYRRERVARGAAIIAGMMPDPGAIHAQLRTVGFSAREVGDLWPEIVGAASRLFRETNAAGASS